MARNSFNLSVVISAVDRLTPTLRRVNRAMGGLGRSVGRIAGRLGRMAGPLTAFAGALSVAGIVGLARNYAAAGDEISKFARQTGLGTKALQELQFAADRSGISQAEFNTSMIAFTKRLGEMKAGTGGLFTLMNKVAPSWAKQLKSAKSTNEAFEMMIGFLAKIKDPTRRAALAAAAFSRAGVKMTRMAEGGVEGVRALRLESRDYGHISEEAGRAAEQFQDRLGDLSPATTGLRNAIGEKLLPVLQPVIEKLTAFIAANRENIAAKLGAAIGKIAGHLERLDFARVVAGVEGFFEGAGRVVDFLGGIQNALIGVAAVLSAGLIGDLLGLAGALGKVGLALAANPIGAAIMAVALAVYAIYDNWDGIVEWFEAKLAGVSKAFDEGLLQGIVALIREFNPVVLIAEAINGLIEYLTGVDLFEAGSQMLASLVRGLEAQLPNVSGVLDDIGGFFGFGDDDQPGAAGSASGKPLVAPAQRVQGTFVLKSDVPGVRVEPGRASSGTALETENQGNRLGRGSLAYGLGAGGA